MVDTEHISGGHQRLKKVQVHAPAGRWGVSYCSLDRGGQAGICGPSDKANPGEARNPGAPLSPPSPPWVTPVRGIKASREWRQQCLPKPCSQREKDVKPRAVV